MNLEDRNMWNGIGACVLVLALLCGTVVYIECIHPERMAKLGYVKIESGRYVPHEDSRVEKIEMNYKRLVRDLKSAMNKIQSQLNRKKDK